MTSFMAQASRNWRVWTMNSQNKKNDNESTQPIFLLSQEKKNDEETTTLAQNRTNDNVPTPIFPPEVVIEILTWLPPKCLIQLQLVCKEWRAFIQDHYFTEKHMGRHDFVHHWHNVARLGNYPQNNRDEDSFAFIQGCDGLVILRNNTKRKFCVWNPATHRVLELPNPNDGYYGFAFSFVPSTKSYRIVCIFKDKESGGLGWEVLTPGQSMAWRRLTFPDIANSIQNREKERVSIVSSGGAVHCVLVTKFSEEIETEIVSLDLETENFSVNHLPKLGWSKYCDLDWDGKLGFARIVGQNMELMELEDYKNQKWCEKKKIIHLPFLKKGNIDGEANLTPLFAREGYIWFWLKDTKVFRYENKSGDMFDVKQSQDFVPSSKIYPYKPSMITFKGMVPDTEVEKLRPVSLDRWR
ncbi:hypothetical protein DH2020_042255 [Rehmannia glutinosa]|uniref:F-box domain-containing protein n=1 Tax=Rehmannia glutinosa TaxID=99300 RepID=A0ABR0UN29_REHGL